MSFSFRHGVVGLLLATVPAAAPSAELFSDEQKAAIEQMIHDYYLDHPKEFIEAVKRAQSEAPRHAIAERRSDLFNDPESPVAGNALGDITVVEFLDYRCPYCRRAEPVIDTLLGEDRGVRVVYKDLPVLGAESKFAARAALAAAHQGRYLQLHKALMDAPTLTNDVVLALADAAGLDRTQLTRDMDSPEVEAVVAHNAELAGALGVKGTPAFVVGDTFVPGAIELARLRELIASQRRAAQPSASGALSGSTEN